MKETLINYMVKTEKVAENIQLIKEVLKQLKESQLKGIKYASYQMGDNLFVHIAQFENEAAHHAFTNLPAFQAFRRNINDRIIEKPITNEIAEIGRYAAF